jgi:hypothetical protein
MLRVELANLLSPTCVGLEKYPSMLKEGLGIEHLEVVQVASSGKQRARYNVDKIQVRFCALISPR